MVKILTIIPARSGSKGIPNKNIRLFQNRPLIAWSIQQALDSDYREQMKIIVSTDSEQYREIAINYGAEAPFIRPSEISEDHSTDFECIHHCVEWLKENQDYEPDIIVQLRPTQPLRKIRDINQAISLFMEKRKQGYDSLRSVVKIDKSAYKMYTITGNVGSSSDSIFLNPIASLDNIEEPYNQCRQVLPDTYLHNGYIDILNSSILSSHTISGSKILPYVMEPECTHDIDTIKDWELAQIEVNNSKSDKEEKKKISKQRKNEKKHIREVKKIEKMNKLKEKNDKKQKKIIERNIKKANKMIEKQEKDEKKKKRKRDSR